MLQELVLEKLYMLQKPTKEAHREPEGKSFVLQCLSITHYCQSLELSQLTKTTEKVQLHFCTVGNKE